MLKYILSAKYFFFILFYLNPKNNYGSYKNFHLIWTRKIEVFKNKQTLCVIKVLLRLNVLSQILHQYFLLFVDDAFLDGFFNLIALEELVKFNADDWTDCIILLCFWNKLFDRKLLFVFMLSKINSLNQILLDTKIFFYNFNNFRSINYLQYIKL